MKRLVIALAIALMAGASMADLISVTATNRDQGALVYATSNSMSYIGQQTVRIGDTAAGIPMVYVVPFQLPVLSEGSAISDVSLNVYSTNKVSYSGTMIYMDIVGWRVSASPNVITNEASMTGGTVIGDNVQLVNQTITVPLDGNYTLNPSYFQGIYDNDASAAGKFVFLLLRMDGIDPTASNSYIEFLTADSAVHKPVLNITTTVIPEPATIGMLGLGVLIAGAIRRIRTR